MEVTSANLKSEWSTFPVVGIGASAGGLEALELFFDHVPERTGMAFVIVQHLSPTFKSLMDELLSRHTVLPIALAEEGMLVEPDHVYLLPPKKELIISQGRLLLSERQQELSLPIDVFFRSLARDCGQRAVAIVLSGGGSDGSRGAREVREHGGLVIVQDVDSAQFDGMPKTALDAGVADWVLPPSDMPRVLLEHAARLRQPGAISDSAPKLTGIDAVYKMLQDEFGIDFTHYKPTTVTRRIDRRLSLAHSLDMDEYVARLRDQREELDVLYRDLLIGVTRFFRDPKAFELLEQQVLPELLKAEPEAPIRVWVAGCATGEEAYSFAISLQDLLFKLNMPNRQVKIFATDVHRGSLERAARALYDREALANVSGERLQRYFVRIGDSYQVIPDLRQMIVFAAHDVIKDAPFTRMDLISCRNLLIYLQPPAQQRALSMFHFALNRGGVLMLGPSESTGALGRDFDTVDKHWRIYRKHSERRVLLDTRIAPQTRSEPKTSLVPLDGGGRYTLGQLLGTYDAMLDQVMPPSLLVNERGELIHTWNGGSRWLHMRDGRQGLDILELLDPQLKMVLAPGLKRALSEGGPIVFNGVRMQVDGEDRLHRLTLRRVQSPRGGPRHVLVTCEPQQDGTSLRAAELRDSQEFDLDQISREQLSTLEAELSHTKENLQAAIEELETSNEELQASNEELQASNEELQSTNEELQSVNEELYTVNSEYQRKIGELTELTNDMDNLLSSTDVGTIFLDRQLRIRRFTPQIAQTFNLVAHDVGRSIETFGHKLEHPELLRDLKQVRESAEPIERELRGPEGRAYFLRILPYRSKGMVDGVVLTLLDMTGMKAAEDALFHERYLLNSLLAMVPDAIYFKDKSGRFIRANHAFAERLGVSDPRELIGKVPFEVPQRELALAMHAADEAVLRTGEVEHYKLEQRAEREWDLVTRLPLRGKGDEIVGVIAIMRSVTEQKLAEEKIQEAVRRRDQFLAMLSHELRNPLGAMVTATNLLKSGADTPAMHDKLLDVLTRQSRQMAHLLDDLLEASRVTQNKIELRRENVDLRDVINQAVDALRGPLAERNLRFSCSIPDEPLYVWGDATRLQQIHANLLSNAAKYTQPGGAVELTVKRDGEHALIEVRDSGAGIAPDMLESVFELFVQSNRTLDRSAGGLGVGLTLARSLVQLHGGTICACSDGEGKGSSFQVRLPLTAAPAETEQRGGESSPRFTRGKKIVVVEDSEDSRELLCEFLKRAGYDCHAADSGPGALELIERERPDIALLDVGLPEMDGFEVARRVRKTPSIAKTVLIALTGYGRASDLETSREAGFDRHLVKPVVLEQLLAVLEQARARPEAS